MDNGYSNSETTCITNSGIRQFVATEETDVFSRPLVKCRGNGTNRAERDARGKDDSESGDGHG